MSKLILEGGAAVDGRRILQSEVPSIIDKVDEIFRVAAMTANQNRIKLAKLAVEEAIRRTDITVGTVSGAVGTDGAATVEFGGISHTVFSDGSFSFVAPEGSGIAVVRNASGDEIGSFELTVIAGETTDTGIV